jgi:hypothetical protein
MDNIANWSTDGVEFDRLLRAIRETQAYLDLIDWRLMMAKWRSENSTKAVV